MIALAYFSPPTRQPIDAAESAHRESAAGSLIARLGSAASSIVCPHPDCHRSFVDVARHVRTRHPELVEAAS